jgi:hypothetical protein
MNAALFEPTRNAMSVPALPSTECRIGGSSCWSYWFARMAPTWYLRSSESMLAMLSVVNSWNSSTKRKNGHRLCSAVQQVAPVGS